MLGRTPTRAEYLDAAREMADMGRHFLAHLLAEEAAALTDDPSEAARILRHFPNPAHLRSED
ncbi:hypothetical protein [Streptomyces sp. 3N207]|uniref:hypothetical protein n=1 Tax=Streptomyces sp. 3N207 TaxID=3457417 RepID=UPI003FD0BF5A